jgi:hypothetical protein
MRDLCIADSVLMPAPSAFAAIQIPPNCVFYAHRTAVEQGVEIVQFEIASGETVLPEGMSPLMLAINRQAWALAMIGVAGRA